MNFNYGIMRMYKSCFYNTKENGYEETDFDQRLYNRGGNHGDSRGGTARRMCGNDIYRPI